MSEMDITEIITEIGSIESRIKSENREAKINSVINDEVFIEKNIKDDYDYLTILDYITLGKYDGFKNKKRT